MVDEPKPDEARPAAASPDGVAPDDQEPTTVLPAAGETAQLPRWSARAEVRRETPGHDEPPTGEWVDPYAGRSWFTPIILGVVALLLVVALTAGVLLIYRATHNGNPAAGPSASPTPIATSEEAPSPVASSASPSASASESLPFPMPNVVGSPAATAQAQLSGMGLVVTLTNRPDAKATPGTVLETQPPAGVLVAPGSPVVLVVAVAPPPPVSSAPASSASP
jgi:hypothetical protein